MRLVNRALQLGLGLEAVSVPTAFWFRPAFPSLLLAAGRHRHLSTITVIGRSHSTRHRLDGLFPGSVGFQLAPVFTNRKIQPTRPLQVNKQTRNLSGRPAPPQS
jgi:hypothetical protein